jgi:outer membrane receptor protein involved in Fe transport
LTYHFNERFDLQLGGRESRLKQRYSFVITGPFDEILLGGPSPIVSPLLRGRDNAFTYLLTPRFKLNENVMVYARLASGYRAGGVNNVGLVQGVPDQYAPDKTRTYELGFKGSFLDHRLSLDASLFRIDWKDIQLQLADHGIVFTTNGAEAKSEGVELEFTARPSIGLTLSGWFDYTRAVLSQGLPPHSLAFGLEGDRLPYSSRYSGHLSLEQTFSLADNLTGFGGARVNYVGDRIGTFSGSSLRQTYPAYTTADLEIGLRSASWSGSLFVNNATDKRGLLGGGLGYYLSGAFIYNQPRTIGLTVARFF